MRIKKIKTELKKAWTFSMLSLLIVGLIFCAFEPAQLDAAATANDSVNVNLAVDPTLSISTPADVTMSPNITGTGSSTGSATWTVTTNSLTGWKMEVNASAAPAMVSGSNNFADYTEGTPGTPDTWSVAASASEFGFTASGSFAEAGFSSGTKYRGFQGTTKIQVSHSNTGPDAADATVVGFKAEVGASKSQPTGNYSATVTATATSLP